MRSWRCEQRCTAPLLAAPAACARCRRPRRAARRVALSLGAAACLALALSLVVRSGSRAIAPPSGSQEAPAGGARLGPDPVAGVDPVAGADPVAARAPESLGARSDRVAPAGPSRARAAAPAPPRASRATSGERAVRQAAADPDRPERHERRAPLTALVDAVRARAAAMVPRALEGASPREFHGLASASPSER
jgi:hypothetical protein